MISSGILTKNNIMKELDHEQMLELRNQEFLFNMEKIPTITKELKDRMMKNISALLDHTDRPLEKFRIKQVQIQLRSITITSDSIPWTENRLVGIRLTDEQIKGLKDKKVLTFSQWIKCFDFKPLGNKQYLRGITTLGFDVVREKYLDYTKNL